MSVSDETLADLEKKLADNLFVNGPQPSIDDAAAFQEFINAKQVPDQDNYPSVWAWYSLMVLFEDEVIKSWKPAQGNAQQKEKGGKKGRKQSGGEKKEENEGKKKGKGKKEEKKEEKGDDDDFDPFAEETEEDKAQKEKMKQDAKDKKKDKKEKKKEVEKSHVVLEVKGWEADQDLMALGQKIITTIQKDGLKWFTGYKLEDVAFGIKKLIMALLVEDEKVSVDEIVEELESWENDIQSVEIVSFNKS